MIVLEQGLNGCDEGLNGFNLKKALKKVRLKDVSLKNASKVVKASVMLGVGVPPGLVFKKETSQKSAPKAVNTVAMRGVATAPKSIDKGMCCCSHDDGLNGGLKIAKALKKINLKKVVAVAKTVLPIALSVIPVVGGISGTVVGTVLNKITTNKDGSTNLVGRIAESVQQVAKTDVGKAVVNFATPLVKNATANLLQSNGEIPNDEQIATLSNAKGTTPQQELDAMIAAKMASSAKTAPAVVTPAPAKDNTMLIVGGVAAVGIAYAVLK